MIFKMKLANIFYEEMWLESGIEETHWLVKKLEGGEFPY